MVNSIQNDKITSVSSERGVDNPRERAGKSAPGAEEKDRQSSSPTNDRVEVSGAGRLLSEAPTGTHPSLTTPEQARDLASRVREQLQTLGEQAIRAHSGGDGARLSSLLETAVA